MANPFLDVKNNFLSIFRPEPNHTFALDGWRSLAMFWIISQHVMLAIGGNPSHIAAMQTALKNPNLRVIFHAHFGVDIFFVISGYLIGGIIIREKRKFGTVQMARFYARRVLRMVPIYYFVLLALVFAVSQRWLTMSYFLTPAWPNFLYLNNFVGPGKEFFPPAWSLAIEEQFYVLFPPILFLVSASSRKLTLVFGSIIAAVMVIHFGLALHFGPHSHWLVFQPLNPKLSDQYHDFIYVKPYTRFSSLFIGALAYVVNSAGLAEKLFATRLRNVCTLITAVSLIAFVFTFITYDLNKEQSPFFESSYREIFCVGFVLFIFGSLYSPPLKALFSRKFYYPLFQLSYGIYLVHAPVLIFLLSFPRVQGLLSWDNPKLSQILTISVLGLITSAIVTIPLYVFIERPFITIRQRLFS